MSLCRSSAEPPASATSRRSSKWKTAKSMDRTSLERRSDPTNVLIALAIGGFRALQPAAPCSSESNRALLWRERSRVEGAGILGDTAARKCRKARAL